MAKLPEKKSTKQLSGVIERTAINPTGRLGSLYDGIRDILIGEIDAKCRYQWVQSFELSKFELIKGTVDLNFNLLKCIGIQSEIRLSLLLNTRKRSGIADVLNYPHREKKEHSITNLKQQNFDYMNEAEYNIDQNNRLKTVEHKLLESDQHKLFLCSNDTLNKNNSSNLAGLRKISKKRQSNPSLNLTSVDISNYSFQHDEIIALPSNNIDYSKTHINQNISSLDNISQSPSIVPLSASSLVSNDGTINILLLGETGVGKSTFINAFANYLLFQSLEQAESNELIVVIPVSFIMTTGENFEERTVKFGEIDNFNNENFNTVGQSVTQHCKSYAFDLKRSNDKNRRRKLRIIDTPDFGDTRGVDQDKQNIEHILQYINNLTHLHAICFLLKPNASRLNVFFRTCFMQLFSFLAPTAQRNIIFCFTNARSTFYTPGNTAPLLKRMLASLSTNDISFKKENTFCFDSKSFQYLVAL
ncbi:unnamed protein product [Rotaria sp. Silwood2]|nr:unnamed protein product [Rotaria sp. Silwood2]CAF4347888.1 unnamed protein product [Rotaria sp. Silwood2]